MKTQELKIMAIIFAGIFAIIAASAIITIAIMKETYRIEKACAIDKMRGYPVNCDVY